jgi:hypothetical protein
VIVQFGKGDENPYGKWADDPRVFISRPYFKVAFDNGLGFYILNAFRFNLFPRFYGTFRKSFWEFGFSVLGWTFEVMWNKAFAKE